MQHIALIILLLLAGGYKMAENLGMNHPLLSSYFEDLIAVPLILLIAQTMIQHLRANWRSFLIAPRDVYVITLLFSLYFEGLIPLFDKRFTADPLDIICYTLGASLFLQLNRYERKNSVNKLSS
jgi:hypothetical protein